MTVSEQIIQILDNLCSKIGIAIDWTSENMIPYVEMLSKKLITYEICMSVLGIVFKLLLIFGTVVVAKKLAPIFKAGRDEVGTALAVIGACFVVGICILASCSEIVDIVKCITFPELYIFEYVQTLMPQ